MNQARKLIALRIWIIALFALEGILIGAVVAASLYAAFTHYELKQWMLFALVGGFGLSLLLALILALLFAARSSLLALLAENRLHFEGDHAIYDAATFRKSCYAQLRRPIFLGKGTVIAVHVFSRTKSLQNVIKSVNTILLDVLFFELKDEKDLRFGLGSNDEFLFFFPGPDHDQAIEKMKRFASSLAARYERRGDLPYLTILLGAENVESPGEFEEAVRRTIFALHHDADNRISGDLLRFDPAMEEEELARRDLDAELTRALANDELVVYYQGKFDLHNNVYFGAEALVRWKHPRRGILPPSVFIPYCEYSGRIVEIDRYLFEHVCADIEKWNGESNARLTISVNLSRRSVYDPSLLSFLKEVVTRHHIYPSQIDVELTESLAATNVVFIADIIRKIKQEGFRTSIDDFGIGYSSLSALKSIPFDVLKIDKSFIDDIETDVRARGMVKSIIELVHGLSMRCIAEGVETKAQVDYLQAMGLDSVQGYYFARPVERSQFETLIETKRKEAEERKRAERKAAEEAASLAKEEEEEEA